MNKLVQCKEYGQDGCLGDVDPAYTMLWDDIGEPPMYFCSYCGPIAQECNTMIMEALDTRGPKFAKDLEQAIRNEENKVNN